jgi:hypothetical protein
LKKKNQKNFSPLYARLVLNKPNVLKLPSLTPNRSQNGQKFFWFFFSKKELLAFLP